MKSYTSGSRRIPTPFPFDLDGVRFVCRGSVMLLDLCEFARAADLDVQDPRAIVAINDVFRAGLADEYNRFAQHCRTHNTEPEVLLDILTDLIQHMTGKDSGLSSPSSPGRPNTNGSSTPGSPNGGSSTVEERTHHLLTDEEIAAWRATANPTVPPVIPGEIIRSTE